LDRRTIRVVLLALAAIIAPAQAQGTTARATQTATSSAPDGSSATTSADQARELIREGHYAEAESLARELLIQEEARSGSDSLPVAEILDIVVEAGRLGGKLKDPMTREAARRAIKIKEDLLGADHPDVARSVNNLANLLVESGDYAGAKPLYERVLRIQDQKLDPNDPLIAKTLNNFANLISDMGDYTGSRPLYERALHIKEGAYGPEDPQLISTLLGLAILMRLTGEYMEARHYCERAVHIADVKLRPGHPRRGSTMATLASIAVEMGDYAEARNLLERTLALQERELEPDHPDLAATLGDLANLHKDAGDLNAARALYERSLGIQTRSLETESAYLVPNLTSLGEVLLKLGDAEGARVQLEHGLKIREAEFGPDHPDVAESLGALAELLEKKSDLTAAKVLLERGLQIREKALGQAHPLVAVSLARLAHVAARSGDDSNAVNLAHRAEAIGRQHLRVISAELPERQALRYASTRPSGLDVELEVASRRPTDAWTWTAWDDLIRSRALVLDEMAARHHSALVSEDSATQKLRLKLAAARAQEAALWVRGLEEQDPASYRRILEDARKGEEQFEGELAEKSLEFRREQLTANVGLSEIIKAIPRDSALVAYALTQRAASGSGSEAPRYVAFVLGPSSDIPHVVRLGLASAVDDLVSRWRASVAAEPSPVPAIAQPEGERSRKIGTNLRVAIWDPVVRHVRGARKVFVVPDGTLNLVSFAALPTREDRYLVETGPVLHYLSAETDLAQGVSAPRGDSGLFAVGGPDFDGLPGKPQLADGGTGTTGANARAFRGPGPGCVDLQALHFDPLPGASREAEEVGAVWVRKRPDAAGSILNLDGALATKASVERFAPQHGVVHLATHAFFLNEECLPPEDRLAVNPLLLSGLAFAGANHRTNPGLQAPPADAILTAEEIASMDLSRVTWVVLSGCETGLGKIHPGEGVLGLRRAVQVAGARTLIMSLWKAKDEPTRRWMDRLYERRLSGLSTAEAVRAASLDIIASRRAAGDSAHPFFWGAFVAAGDWR